MPTQWPLRRVPGPADCRVHARRSFADVGSVAYRTIRPHACNYPLPVSGVTIRLMRLGLWLVVACALGCGGARVPDLEGQLTDPLADVRDRPATVLAFLSSECPISDRYLPELRKLATQFASAHLRLWLVYPNRSDTAARIRAHLSAFDGAHELPVLRDPEHRLVQRAGVHITPEVALFDRTGTLIYAGRIDDRYAALGIMRASATEHDLARAIDSLLSGRPATPRRTAAIGCTIAD
jgi:hypothetical protein